MKMRTYLQISLAICICISFSFFGCVGRGAVKVSEWTSPNTFAMDQVFNAAVRAGTENKFSIINSDRSAGIISMRKEQYGGDKKNIERLMSVRLKQVGDKIVVSTKISGGEFGLIEGTLGGKVHEEITRNFYVYLFRELNITDPALRKVVITDER